MHTGASTHAFQVRHAAVHPSGGASYGNNLTS